MLHTRVSCFTPKEVTKAGTAIGCPFGLRFRNLMKKPKTLNPKTNTVPLGLLRPGFLSQVPTIGFRASGPSDSFFFLELGELHQALFRGCSCF